ncbi:hypothetical protein HDV00_004857 [Rhizophlyctis rosea]|nr:hypothetical protein HDV00_004857 [Rhizophlyctis rosea]
MSGWGTDTATADADGGGAAWDSSAGGDDWQNMGDSAAMEGFGFNGDAGGDTSYGDTSGGGGRRGGGCHNCGQEGHMSRECPEPKKPRDPCRNCNQLGHWTRECPQPRKPLKPRDGESCRDCGSTEHYSRDCPGVPYEPREKMSDEECERLWGEIVKADKEGDFEDVKDALVRFVDADPTLTWVAVEERLRGEGLRTHVLAEKRVIPPNKEFANIAGAGDQRFEVIFVRNPRVLKLKIKTDAEKEENKTRLAQAGLMRDRRRVGGKLVIPAWAEEGLTQKQIAYAKGACTRCFAEDHRVKDCTVEREERHVGECYKCGEKGHSHRVCPNPDENRMRTGCRRCGKEGHKLSDCPEPERCRRCNEEGHQQRDCPIPDPNMICRRCEKPGHRASECDKPEKCFNCDGEGHQSRECPEPRKPRRGPMKCFNCQEENHSARDCPNPEQDRPPRREKWDGDNNAARVDDDASAAPAATAAEWNDGAREVEFKDAWA